MQQRRVLRAHYNLGSAKSSLSVSEYLGVTFQCAAVCVAGPEDSSDRNAPSVHLPFVRCCMVYCKRVCVCVRAYVRACVCFPDTSSLFARLDVLGRVGRGVRGRACTGRR